MLVGASGGMDSTVLVDALIRLGYGIEVAHVNYALRDGDSEADELLVRTMSQGYGVPCHVEYRNARDCARRLGISVQMAARDLRYEVFAELATRQDLAFVAVGHHADDQAETVLLNLSRGSGPEGLAGMPYRRALGGAALVRPLLRLSRSDIADYARHAGLQWREDKSNSDIRYRRVVVRSRVIPALSEVLGPRATDNIARSAELMREYVEAVFEPELREQFSRAAHGRKLNLKVLDALPEVWQRRMILEALRRWLPGAPASFADSVWSLLASQPGRRAEARAGTVWRGREVLRFDRSAEHDEGAEAWLNLGQTIDTPVGRLGVSLMDERPISLHSGTPAMVYADADQLKFPLLVRRWLPGDRMIPLGMTQARKVSDVLTDAKVRVGSRSKAQVVISGSEIVWLVCVRLSGSFRVCAGTRRVARFEVDALPGA